MKRFLHLPPVITHSLVTLCFLIPTSLPANPHHLITMEFVTIGDARNEPDPTTKYYGNVNRNYEIGKYDVTAKDYCAFLNAVAQDDPNDLYNEQMEYDPNIACIQRHSSPGSYYYTLIKDGKHRADFPVTYVSWYAAARFCNWMQNRCPTGPQGPGTTETGTYSFQDSPNAAIHINEDATYFLPTENEWYKAAYYFNHGQDRPLYWFYPTKSDFAPGNTIGDKSNQANYREGLVHTQFTNPKPPYLTPVGSFKNSPSPYGVYDMGGNVFQWTSSRLEANNYQSFFVARGGSWNSEYGFFNDLQSTTRAAFDPQTSSSMIGFRLVKRHRSF